MMASHDANDPWPRRVALALCLFFLSPMTAEYLIGYDSTTGDPGALLAGLLILGPLYGGPALIIREAARRAGMGWPTMILLGLAFGVIQAGLIDHSLFNESYRDIEYWEASLRPTFIPALGISANHAQNFILGHAIWSFGVPIALVEALSPRREKTPWLGKLGLFIVVVLYLLAATLVFRDHLKSEQFLPTVPQLAGAAAVAAALIGAAFAAGKRSWPSDDLPAPSPWLVGTVSLLALSLSSLIGMALGVAGIDSTFEDNWWGFGVNVLAAAALAALAARWSRRAGWSAAHTLAMAGGALLTRAWLAFLVEPIGDVPLHAKLAHNVGFAVGSAAILALAARSIRRERLKAS